MTRSRYIRIFILYVVFIASIGDLCGENPANHWAYQPVVRPPVPGGGTAGNPIDAFLDAALTRAGMTPNPEARREDQLRRLSFNLTGLPPTPAEIRAFLADTSPEAYEKAARHLLDSPHYGERWGRHWLDVARYVPGKVKVPGIDRIDLAEEYRDYVVRAFNEDKPYGQFVLEQIAGDTFSGGDFRDRLAAPAFLSIGSWFDECTDPNKLKLDIADEQISTLTKAFLGLDFSCARCHDHKKDPIPTRDYYAMAGIFRSTRIISDFNDFWKDGRPRLVQPFADESTRAQRDAEQTQLERSRQERWSMLNRLRNEFMAAHEAEFRRRSTELPAQTQMRGWEAEDFSGHKNLVTLPGKYTPAIETRVPHEQWVQYEPKLEQGGAFLLYLRFASPVEAPVRLEINGNLFPERLPVADTGGKEYQNYRWQAYGPFVFREGANRLRLLVDRHEPFPRLDALKIVKNALPEPTDPLGKALWRHAHSQTFWPPMASEMEILLADALPTELVKVNEAIAALRKKLKAYTPTLAVSDETAMVEEAVHPKGKTYLSLGDPVPRGVPTALFPGLAEKYPVPPDQSGRDALARWITDPGNALTPRVIVNRLWQWHFGEGIVATADNFGLQGAPPVNRDLLDWLAAELVENDGSIKHLQYLIITSQAYRRASDPVLENTPGGLLASFPKRRLESEALYDGMLGALDKLERQPSGRPLDTSKSKDRALYVLVSARSPKGLGLEIRKMFDLFGFDPSGRPIHRRPASVTPDQPLWFLNNPLPRYYADQLAAQLLTKDSKAMETALEEAFLRVLGHAPSEIEWSVTLDYLDQLRRDNLTDQDALARIILGLFSSDGYTFLQ